MKRRLKRVSVFLLCAFLMLSCCAAPVHASVEHNDAFVGRWDLVPDEQNEEGELILAVDGTGTMRCNTGDLLHVLYGQNWKLSWDFNGDLNIDVVEDSSGYANTFHTLYELREGKSKRVSEYIGLGCCFEFDYDSTSNTISFYDCTGDVHRFEYDDSWKAEALENTPKAWMIEIGDPQDYDYGYFFLNADGSGQCELRSKVYEGDELVEKMMWYSSFSWEPRMLGFDMKLDRDFYRAYLEKDKVYAVMLNGFAGHFIEAASEIKSAELEGDFGNIHMRRVEATPSEVEPIPSYESDSNQSIEYMANKTKFSVGDRVYLGKYEQDNDTSNGAEDIEWRILDIEDGQALLISEYALDGLSYDLEYQNYVHDEADRSEDGLLSEYIPDGFDYYSENWKESLQSEYVLEWLDKDTRYWRGSYVRAWLNEGFLNNAFSETEASNVQETLCKNGWDDFDETKDTMDRVFLLSPDEVERYMPIKKDRQTIATDYALDDKKVYEQNDGYCNWWLRTIAHTFDYKGEYVESYGFISDHTTTSSMGIRPAMWYALPEGTILEEEGTYDSITALKEESFAVGDTLSFGSYEQDYDSTNGSEPILWRILSIDENNIALAISVKVLDRTALYEHDFGDESLDDSALIAWLNEGFMSNAFTDEEADYMRGFPYVDIRSSYKVALLLTSEVEQFMPALKEGLEGETEFVKHQYESVDKGWWVYRADRLKTGKGDGMIVSYETGEIQSYDKLYNAGVRPLIRIQLNHSSKENGKMKEQQNNANTDAAYETQDAASTDFQWAIREDNTVTLVRYLGQECALSIPTEYEGFPVTEIADGAFSECFLLEKVVIPESVIRIGTKAFYKCNLLESVVLPTGEIEFGKFIFNNCPNVVLYVQAGSPAEEYARERTLEYSNK